MTQRDSFRKTGPQAEQGNNTPQAFNPNQEYENMLRTFTKTQSAKVSEEQRNKLILEANKLLNQGNIEKARLIYSALNYYSGLVRIGNVYYKEGKILEAFATFYHAGAKKEIDKLSKDIASAITNIM